jgi:NADPH oxidase
MEVEPWYKREFTGRKLLWNVLWQGLHWGLFAYGWYGTVFLTDCRYSQQANQKLALLNTLRYSVWVSRGAGLVLLVDGFLIILAVCRNLVRWLRPKIRFLPLDENLWFHRQTAYMLLLFTILHTTAHYVNFFVCHIHMRLI